MGPLVRVKSSARLRAAVLALGTTPLALGPAVAAETPSSEIAPTLLMGAPLAAPSPYHIQKVGNQGIKLTSKNAENSYAITVLGSNAEAANTPVGDGGVAEIRGRRSAGKARLLREDRLAAPASRNFESSYDFGPYGPQSANALGMDRRALEEFSFTTQFLGDRVSVTSSRRASDYGGLDPALTGRGGEYEQEKFNAWVWRSDRSSLSVEGTSSRVDSGFQNLMQAMQTRAEESQQIKSKFSYGRAGFFVGHRERLRLSPDTGIALSRQSDIETGASLRLVRPEEGGPLLYLLPDSVWVSTNRGSVVQGDPLAYEARPMEKSSVGMTRAWGYGSVNMSYWQSAVDAPAAIADERWRSHGMDVGGTLNSGRLSMSGNVSFYTADTMAALEQLGREQRQRLACS